MRILSIGFVRELWLPPGEMPGDTGPRLAHYATRLDAYHVLVPTLATGVTGRRPIGSGFWAEAVPGRTAADLLVRTAWAAVREGRRIGAEAVQAQDPVHSGLPAFIAARALGVPVNLCVYGTNPFDAHWVATTRLNRATAPLSRALLRRADGVQADGSETARSLVANGIAPERVALKPMIPTNLDAFFEARPDPSVRAALLGIAGADAPGDALIGLFVGRLVPQKHLALLVEVLDATRTRLPNLRIALVGEGPDRAAIETFARERGVGERLIWLGPRAHGALPDLMAAADVFVLPSNYEGFARVLMEAGAAGLPIVTTQVSGADDAVVDGVTGHIVPVGDAGAVASALASLADDSERRRMGEAGRTHLRTVAARYGSLDVQLDIWRDLIARSRS